MNIRLQPLEQLNGRYGLLSNTDLTYVYSSTVQTLHGNAEALSLGSQPIGHRNNTVLEDHCPSWLGVPAHLGETGTTHTLSEGSMDQLRGTRALRGIRLRPMVRLIGKLDMQ